MSSIQHATQTPTIASHTAVETKLATACRLLSLGGAASLSGSVATGKVTGTKRPEALEGAIRCAGLDGLHFYTHLSEVLTCGTTVRNRLVKQRVRSLPRLGVLQVDVEGRAAGRTDHVDRGSGNRHLRRLIVRHHARHRRPISAGGELDHFAELCTTHLIQSEDRWRDISFTDPTLVSSTPTTWSATRSGAPGSIPGGKRTRSRPALGEAGIADDVVPSSTPGNRYPDSKYQALETALPGRLP